MRVCPNCKEEVMGRKDKIFCTPYCKSAYHYEKDKDNPPTRFQQIDHQLKLNRRILAKFNQAGKATVRKSTLIEQGFLPQFFTNYWKNRQGDVYLFCYEFGFLERTENGKAKYILVHWQPYMDKT